jgi:flagellar biogenesis protein FliO
MTAQSQTGTALSALPLRRDGAQDPSMAGVWVFLAVLAAAALAAIWFKRLRKVAPETRPQLQRLESLALTSQASLHVVRWGEEELLLGCSPGAVKVVSRRPLDKRAHEAAP